MKDWPSRNTEYVVQEVRGFGNVVGQRIGKILWAETMTNANFISKLNVTIEQLSYFGVISRDERL